MSTRELKTAAGHRRPGRPSGWRASTSPRWKPRCSPTSRGPAGRRPGAAELRSRRRPAPRRRRFAASCSPAARRRSPSSSRPRRRPRRRRISDRTSRAYGAELVRFAESTPLLLLEGPGWRVQNGDEYKTGKASKGRWNSSPATRSPTKAIRHGRHRASRARSSGDAPDRVRQRMVNSAGATAACGAISTASRVRIRRPALVKLPVARHDRRPSTRGPSSTSTRAAPATARWPPSGPRMGT